MNAALKRILLSASLCSLVQCATVNPDQGPRLKPHEQWAIDYPDYYGEKETVPEKFDTKIIITQEKKDYLVQEPIFIKILVENGDENGPRICGQIEEFIDVWTEDGKKLWPTSHGEYEQLNQMAPNTTWERVINLADEYSPDFEQWGDFHAEKLTVKANWHEKFYESLESNTLTFNIREPEGKEREAWLIYRDARAHSYGGNFEKAYEILGEMNEKYPDSIYDPLATNKRIWYHILTDKDPRECILLCGGFLEKYPEHYFADHIRFIKEMELKSIN